MLIAGNWKMFKGPAEAREFCRALRERVDALEGIDVAVCPPYVSLGAAVEELGESEIAVFAQNVHWADEGAFTGEVSPAMLLEVGVDGALVATRSGGSSSARPTRAGQGEWTPRSKPGCG